MSGHDPNWRRRPKFWTPERLWRLSELLERGWDDERIGREFGRSGQAINLARKRYGLRPRTRLAYSAQRVARMLGLGCAKIVTRWIEAGWIRAHQGPRLGPNRHWMVSHANLLRFLENPEHWHRWDPERMDSECGLQWWAREIRRGVRFLTVGEVAERFYVTTNAVNDWIHQGILPARRNGNWLVLESDLEGFTPPGQRERAGQPVRGFTPEEDATILRMRAAGKGWREIGRALGRRPSAVCNRWRRLQTGKPKYPRYYTPEEDRRLLELRASGLSWPQIGRQLSRSAKSLERRYRLLQSLQEPSEPIALNTSGRRDMRRALEVPA